MLVLHPLFDRIIHEYAEIPGGLIQDKDLSVYLLESAKAQTSAALPDLQLIAGALQLAQRELSRVPSLTALCSRIDAELQEVVRLAP